MTDNKPKKTRDEVLKEINDAHAKRHALSEQLLSTLKSSRAEIEMHLNHFRREEPDLIYRFYHQSFKVFILNGLTKNSVEFFKKLAPTGCTLNGWFIEIADNGLSKQFSDDTNQNWFQETLPVLQAFWHCRYFLEQMLAAADELDQAPQMLPSGWATVLYLYDLR